MNDGSNYQTRRPDIWAMPYYSYHWIHTPSGAEGVRQVSFIDRAAFLHALNFWNRLGNPVWTYTEVPNSEERLVI